jgi:hypothetical protein
MRIEIVPPVKNVARRGFIAKITLSFGIGKSSRDYRGKERDGQRSVARWEQQLTEGFIKRGIRGNGGIRGDIEVQPPLPRVFRHFRVFRVLSVVLKEPHPLQNPRSQIESRRPITD